MGWQGSPRRREMLSQMAGAVATDADASVSVTRDD